MILPDQGFAPNDSVRAFIQTAQYIASMLPGANVLEESGQVIHFAFAADSITFVKQDAEVTLLTAGEVGAEARATIVGMVRQVFESGFMASENTSGPHPTAWIAFPVTVRSRTEAVMLVGYAGDGDPSLSLLESLLGVAALVGSALERQLTYHELRDAGVQTQLILDAIGDGVCRIDPAGIVTFANNAALDILGYTERELIGAPATALAMTEEDLVAAPDIRREVNLRRRDGALFPAELICAPISNIGKATGVVVTFSDITDRKAKAVLSKMAYHDQLTELPNRRHLIDRLEAAIANARRRKLQLAVLFLDLDLFKQINDTLGHHVGDQVLIEVANRLCQCVRLGDTVSRLGGDEFVILQLDLKDNTDAVLLANRLIASITQTMHLFGHALNISVSIGIALCQEGNANSELLLKCADNAMYRAKQAGRNRYLLYTDSTPP